MSAPLLLWLSLTPCGLDETSKASTAPQAVFPHLFAISFSILQMCSRIACVLYAIACLVSHIGTRGEIYRWPIDLMFLELSDCFDTMCWMLACVMDSCRSLQQYSRFDAIYVQHSMPVFETVSFLLNHPTHAFSLKPYVCK